uniref:Roadblock/LAMTOR2 domain-containing protein n=1 Tax=Anopheles maculatus TaxID=74869 RepID=A0A182T9X3_9DIPT
MTDDVKRFFHNIRKRYGIIKTSHNPAHSCYSHGDYSNAYCCSVAGLNCIIITDRDGVPLMKVGDDKSLGMIMKPSFHTTFTMATEQSNKLGLGRNRNIISIYTGYQVVQMNKLPLLVTFIGTESCNIGHILALDQQIELVLDEVKVAVTET